MNSNVSFLYCLIYIYTLIYFNVQLLVCKVWSSLLWKKEGNIPTPSFFPNCLFCNSWMLGEILLNPCSKALNVFGNILKSKWPHMVTSAHEFNHSFRESLQIYWQEIMLDLTAYILWSYDLQQWAPLANDVNN